MTFTSISSLGSNGKTVFYDEDGKLTYFSEYKKNLNENSMLLFKKDKVLISKIKYFSNRDVSANNYKIYIDNQEYLFKNCGNKVLHCTNGNFYLKRNFFDKGFSFFSENKKLMKVKTYSFFRDYLRAKYYINIDNSVVEEKINFFISVCLLYFILVYESSLYTQAMNFGSC